MALQPCRILKATCEAIYEPSQFSRYGCLRGFFISYSDRAINTDIMAFHKFALLCKGASTLSPKNPLKEGERKASLTTPGISRARAMPVN